MPAANHSFYLRHCYLQNDLAEGRLEIGGERLDPKKIDMPIYELAAREDHIAPAKSVFVGARLFAGPVRFVLAGSGHIAGVINPPGPKVRYQYWTGGPPREDLESWLNTAQENPGSWWRAGIRLRGPGSAKIRAEHGAPRRGDPSQMDLEANFNSAKLVCLFPSATPAQALISFARRKVQSRHVLPFRSNSSGGLLLPASESHCCGKRDERICCQ
jgi:hypothetical protein